MPHPKAVGGCRRVGAVLSDVHGSVCATHVWPRPYACDVAACKSERSTASVNGNTKTLFAKHAPSDRKHRRLAPASQVPPGVCRARCFVLASRRKTLPARSCSCVRRPGKRTPSPQRSYGTHTRARCVGSLCRAEKSLCSVQGSEPEENQIL